MLCLKGEDKEPEDEYDPLPFSLRWRLHFGKRDKDPNSGQDVIRLGSNRLIQTHCANTEYQALKLVDRHTSVPTYKVLGIYNRPDGKMVEYEAIPGKPLSSVWKEMSTDKKSRIIHDMSRFIDQLRKIEPPKHWIIGDATLGAAEDHRFGRGKIGPFYSLESFHYFVRRGHAVKDFSEPEVALCHNRETPYQLKFTHANLCPRNILVDDAGRISAIVGWEQSGWYPEYWEYTQLHHASPTEFNDWVDALSKAIPKYELELRADNALRLAYSSAVYDRPMSVRPPSPTPSELDRDQREIDDKNTESTSG